MDVIVLGTDFRPVALIDEYVSLIWTERYREAGDFELVLPISSPHIDSLQHGNYLALYDSDRTMMIEDIGIKVSEEDGTREYVVTGRTLECLLERRIVWDVITFVDEQVQDAVEYVLDRNLLNPDNPARAISGFSFQEIQNDPVIDDENNVVNAQLDGDTLYDAIKSITEPYNIGFCVRLSVSNQFVFNLYFGVNRTVRQFDRDAVVFSPEFDTLISSEYLQSVKLFKNVALVAGETKDDVQKRTTVYTEASEPSGLERRELYVSASDVKSSYEDGDGNQQEISPQEYEALLQYKGFQSLSESGIVETLDGSVETNMGPRYNVDYALGDFVSIVNDYGVNSIAQVTEYIRSFNEEGYSEYPTFTMVS